MFVKNLERTAWVFVLQVGPRHGSYFSGLWRPLNLVASCCLIAGGAFHFSHEQTYGVRVVGALGAHA
eukprot:SAG31_NODE_786_length_12098_cov_15.117446_4_plen_67_part_00